MTRFTDNIFSGNAGLTSAAASRSPVTLCRTHNFTQPAAGGAVAQTQTGSFPSGTQNLDAKLFIVSNGSATVSDKITVSAGGINFITITGFGSAGGILRTTTVGLGTITAVASACAVVNTNVSDSSYSVTFLPVSASKSTSYQLQLTFSRMTAALTNLS